MLCPHPALSPIPVHPMQTTVLEQDENQRTYCKLLVQGVLAVLLPTEDLENGCLRTLVTDVVGESILGNGIGQKACQSWFIWEGVTRISETIKERVMPKATGEEMKNDARSRLEEFGLISTNEGPDAGKPSRHPTGWSFWSDMFWRLLQWGFLAYITIRFVTLGLYSASSSGPSRSSSPGSIPHSSPTASSRTRHGEGPMTESPAGPKRPIVQLRIWSLASHLVDLGVRMPWLSGLFSFCQYRLVAGVGRVGATDGVLDK